MVQTEISLNNKHYLLDVLDTQDALKKLIRSGGIIQSYEGIEIPFFAFDGPVFEKIAEDGYVPNPKITKGHQILDEALYIGNQVRKFIYPQFGISIQTPSSKSWKGVLALSQLEKMPGYFLREPLTGKERISIARNLVSKASSLEGNTLINPWRRTQETYQKLATYKMIIEEFGGEEGIELLEQERKKVYEEHGRRLDAQSDMFKSPGIRQEHTETRYPGGTERIQRYK